MNYKTLDVSRHIINYSHEQGYEITNPKWQLLLYYIQGSFLSRTKRKSVCFKEAIEVTEESVIIFSVYDEYIEQDIPKVNSYLVFDHIGSCHAKREKFKDDVIKDKDKIFIDQIIDQLAKETTEKLQEKIKQQDIWLKAYRTGIGTEIKTDELKAYFDTLR